MNVTFNITGAVPRQTAEQIARRAGMEARRAMRRDGQYMLSDRVDILIATMGLAAILCYVGAAICFVMALT